MNKPLENQILGVDNQSFNQLAVDIFRYQANHNQVYGKFIELLKVNPERIEKLEDIPGIKADIQKVEHINRYDILRKMEG